MIHRAERRRQRRRAAHVRAYGRTRTEYERLLEEFRHLRSTVGGDPNGDWNDELRALAQAVRRTREDIEGKQGGRKHG